MFLPACHIRIALPLVMATLLLHGTSLRAQDPLWGQKMFEVTDINFGAAAKGADSAIQLKVKNVYKEDIQITNLTTGCGCVSWDEISRPDRQENLPIVVPSGQQRLLTLRLDTIRYEGERKSKASVFLLDPVHSAATVVELPVHAYIRKDIVITPGAVNFGNVDAGAGAERKVEILYAISRADWKLTQAKATNPSISVALHEAERGASLVKYELTVTLKSDAAPGVVRDQLILTTNDVSNTQIPVNVEARIEADVSITDLSIGTVAPGQSLTKTVVIRGKKAFKIDELYRNPKDSKLPDEAFKVKLDAATTTVHALPITFTAPDVPGAFEEEFHVKIADRPQEVVFKARGRILEQTGAAKN